MTRERAHSVKLLYMGGQAEGNVFPVDGSTEPRKSWQLAGEGTLF